MTTKDELHHLVDELDDAARAELLDYAQWLTADKDEPLTAEELARVETGKAEIARGEYITLTELRRKLGV